MVLFAGLACGRGLLLVIRGECLTTRRDAWLFFFEMAIEIEGRGILIRDDLYHLADERGVIPIAQREKTGQLNGQFASHHDPTRV